MDFENLQNTCLQDMIDDELCLLQLDHERDPIKYMKLMQHHQQLQNKIHELAKQSENIRKLYSQFILESRTKIWKFNSKL